jgi:hypothetical protein
MGYGSPKGHKMLYIYVIGDVELRMFNTIWNCPIVR